MNDWMVISMTKNHSPNAQGVIHHVFCYQHGHHHSFFPHFSTQIRKNTILYQCCEHQPAQEPPGVFSDHVLHLGDLKTLCHPIGTTTQLACYLFTKVLRLKPHLKRLAAESSESFPSSFLSKRESSHGELHAVCGSHLVLPPRGQGLWLLFETLPQFGGSQVIRGAQQPEGALVFVPDPQGQSVCIFDFSPRFLWHPNHSLWYMGFAVS